MDYNWLGSHDPITYDANLAEIDFDDFKNEDIQNAYAFSLQSYVSPKLTSLIANLDILTWNQTRCEPHLLPGLVTPVCDGNNRNEFTQ